MMTIRKCFALGAASAFAAFAWTVGAQDDLDDLLKDLEGSEKKASAAPAAVQEPQAEKAEEAAAAEESVAEAPAKAEERAYEDTMSREEFIKHNEDARKVYEDIMKLRASIDNLKQTGVDEVPEEIEQAQETIKTQQTYHMAKL